MLLLLDRLWTKLIEQKKLYLTMNFTSLNPYTTHKGSGIKVKTRLIKEGVASSTDEVDKIYNNAIKKIAKLPWR